MSQVNVSDIIISLAEMASPLFQERVWVRPSTEWESSYIECVSRLFDDSGLQDALRSGIVFGDEVDGLLRKIDEVTDGIDFRRAEDSIVADPDFRSCSKIAANVLPFIMLRSGYGM